MKLRIHHLTTYRYSAPVTLQPHRLIVRPRGGPDLTVLEAALVCTPDAAIEWTFDVFGNLIATATFAQPATELAIESDVLVEQCAAEWPVFNIAPHAHSYPFAYSESDMVDLGALIVPQHDDPEGAVRTWAHALVAGTPTDTLSLLKDINGSVINDVAYRTRDEEGTQRPCETLALKSGSCRDIAALFIDAVRTLGFGARAVSGYLYDPDLVQDDGGSTHAWAEVYLPAAGWIAFDPTHRRVGSSHLIAVAVARSNGQIMPVSGGYVGAPGDFAGLDVRVSVAPV